MTDGASPLYPEMERFVRDEYNKLEREFLTPWAFFNSGDRITVKDFHQRPIQIGGSALAFSGSIRDVFWHAVLRS